MNNLDPSHYITILIIIHNTVITNFEKSCSVMVVVCSVVIPNILRHSTVIHLVGLKPGSQYNDNVTLRQEVIQFSMGLVAGIEMISIPATVAATNPLKIV